MRLPLFIHWACLATLLVAAGCKTYGPAFDARQPAAAAAALDDGAFASLPTTNNLQPEWLQAPREYFTLGPGDMIEIEILGDPASVAGALVGPDGRIYYSLLPGLFVWGLTLSEARELLVQELSKFLRVQPVVSVSLRTVASKRVWILGSVQMPGVYSLAAPMTILEALSAAGGAVMTAGTRSGLPDLERSFLLRGGEPLNIDFHRLLSAGDLAQNIYLQPDDFLYLRSAPVRSVYVLGGVVQPMILPYSDELTVLSAIASAGGTLELARVGQVAVVRGSLTRPRVAFVDYKAITRGALPDVRLQPGDIVYVPFVFYRTLALFADQVLKQFVRAVAANEGLNAVTPGAGRVQGTVPVVGP